MEYAIVRWNMDIIESIRKLDSKSVENKTIMDWNGQTKEKSSINLDKLKQDDYKITKEDAFKLRLLDVENGKIIKKERIRLPILFKPSQAATEQDVKSRSEMSEIYEHLNKIKQNVELKAPNSTSAATTSKQSLETHISITTKSSNSGKIAKTDSVASFSSIVSAESILPFSGYTSNQRLSYLDSNCLGWLTLLDSQLNENNGFCYKNNSPTVNGWITHFEKELSNIEKKVPEPSGPPKKKQK